MVTLAIATALGAVPVHAHELQVLAPGPAQIDLAGADRELLIHGTLLEARDLVVVGFDVPRAGTWAVELLVPDAEPERSERSHPSLGIARGDAGHGVSARGELGVSVRDPGTGVTYRSVTSRELRGASRVTITVSSDPEPARFALRVHRVDSDVGFETLDPERTPKTVARLLQWHAVPPPGAKLPRPAAPRADIDWMRREVFVPAAIALGMLLSALWWLLRNRSSARTRGREMQSKGGSTARTQDS